MTVARRVCAAAVACLAVAVVAAPALAHNGVGAAFKGPAGRYTVYAYDGYPLPDGQLEYRVVLLDTASGEPASNVTPVVSARPLNAAGPARTAHVTVMANVVLYDLPNPYPRDWTVTVALTGPLGRGRTHFAMHGRAPYVAPAVHAETGSGGGPWLLIGVGAGVCMAGAAAIAWLLRRRHPDPG